MSDGSMADKIKSIAMALGASERGANYLVTDSLAAQAAKSAYSGVTFPGDVYRGEASPYNMPRVMDLTGVAGASGLNLSRAVPAAAQSLERHRISAGLYGAPQKAARDFSADYPTGGLINDTGRLTADIDGNPLYAKYVAGRNVVGQPDQAIGIEGVSDIGGSLSKYGIDAGYGGREAGNISIDPYTGEVLNVRINKQLSAPQAVKTTYHEVGHVIDQVAGEIPTEGLSKELKALYNTLNTGRERTSSLTGPANLGYKGDDVPREFMAEAIRAYMENPNYIKTVAPNTAARIRQFVNKNDKMNKVVQFNEAGFPVFFQQQAPQDEFSTQWLSGLAT